MTRDDQIRATVAAGMQDSNEIFDALKYADSRDDILVDISSAISDYSLNTDGVYQCAVAVRLMIRLERFARTVLTANAEIDTPQPDDEENEE